MSTSTSFRESEFDELLNTTCVHRVLKLHEKTLWSSSLKKVWLFWEKCFCFHASGYWFHTRVCPGCSQQLVSLAWHKDCKLVKRACCAQSKREQKSTSGCLRRGFIIAFYLLNPCSGFLKSCRPSERLEKSHCFQPRNRDPNVFLLKIYNLCTLELLEDEFVSYLSTRPG